MDTLPGDILAIIFSFLNRNESLNIILVCKKWYDVYLNKSFPPWKIFKLKDDSEYCGLFAVFNVNEGDVKIGGNVTINLDYFYKWYKIAGQRFDLKKNGSYIFELCCDLIDKKCSIELVKFLLDERKRRNEEFDISHGVSFVLFSENIDLAYIIFIDYCYIPISVKVLKKWCTIFCHKRPIPNNKKEKEKRIKLVAWIKNRPEMTQYRIEGRDYFHY